MFVEKTSDIAVKPLVKQLREYVTEPEVVIYKITEEGRIDAAIDLLTRNFNI